MYRGAIITCDGADFIACQDVIENFVQFETVEELRKQPRARGRLQLRGGTCVEQALRVFRLVQKSAELPSMLLDEEIELLPSHVNLGSQLLQLVFLMLEPELEVIEGCFQVGRITRT